MHLCSASGCDEWASWRLHVAEYGGRVRAYPTRSILTCDGHLDEFVELVETTVDGYVEEHQELAPSTAELRQTYGIRPVARPRSGVGQVGPTGLRQTNTDKRGGRR